LPPTPDVSPCSQIDGSGTFDSEEATYGEVEVENEDEERRILEGDIAAYTYSEFKDFFGDTEVDGKWNEATPMYVEFQLPDAALAPAVAPCNQTDASRTFDVFVGEETYSKAEVEAEEERRIVQGDSAAYTYNEFTEFFGEAEADKKWNEAATVNAELQLPEDVFTPATAPTVRRETANVKPVARQGNKGIWGLVKRQFSALLSEETETAIPESEQGFKPGREHGVDASSVSACAVCKTGFHTFRRRYHCRLCGEVCCHDCCSDYVSIRREHNGKEVEIAQRVCGKCFFLTNLKTSRLS
jgi:hypothetical protein